MTKTQSTQTPITLPISGSTYAIVRLDRGRRRIGITRNGVIVQVEHRVASALRTLDSMRGVEELLERPCSMDDIYAGSAVIWGGDYIGHYVSIRATSVKADDELAKIEGQA